VINVNINEQPSGNQAEANLHRSPDAVWWILFIPQHQCHVFSTFPYSFRSQSCGNQNPNIFTSDRTL